MANKKKKNNIKKRKKQIISLEHLKKNKSVLNVNKCRKYYVPPPITVETADVNVVNKVLKIRNKYEAKKNTNPTEIYCKKPTACHKPNASIGLTPKDKCYIITNCERRSNRYENLKIHATNAINNNKIFSIYGCCDAVRKAFTERGWVEKIPPNRMNLSKVRNGTLNKSDAHNELERLFLSNLVEKYTPNFIWYVTDDQRDNLIDMSKEGTTIINKLKIDALWTSKQGLCTSMKVNYWFYYDGVSEVNSPRTYSSYDNGEIDDFVRDYKITACTSLLKWLISNVAERNPIFSEAGQTSLNVIVFAINRCKEYLLRKQHTDIDKGPRNISSAEWYSFLRKYYNLISQTDTFETDKRNKLPLYIGFAKFLLAEILKYRPQMNCEGYNDIWIIKPAHCSRGRGIRIASKLAVINHLIAKANSKYVVQKYIEEPLLIHETKFDIRQYYLVTSTYPLVIWMYTDCYLKFSSQKYNLQNFHESIHLTNNAVQKKYNNCAERHPDLPHYNMWHLDTFKEYLDKIGKGELWDSLIFPGMKKSIIGIMLSCQDSLTVSKNRFELYGCDFILDKEFNPWLIEINSCPDLNHTTKVTAKICPQVINDIIKVVIDRHNDTRASTGKFQCIYRQSMTMPRYGNAADLILRGYALPNEYFSKDIGGDYNVAKESPDEDIKLKMNRLTEMYETNILLHEENEDIIQVEEPTNLDTSEENTESTNDIEDIPKSYNDVVESIGSPTSFNFSKLDDGPLGKGSLLEIRKQPSTNIQEKTELTTDFKISNSIAPEAERILKFLNLKKAQYTKECVETDKL